MKSSACSLSATRTIEEQSYELETQVRMAIPRGAVI